MSSVTFEVQVVVNVVIAIGSFVFGYIMKREIAIRSLELQFKNIDDKLVEIKNDVNGIALFVGTPRALATKAKTETKDVTDGKSV